MINNAEVHVLCTIIHNVMSSVSNAEILALHINTKGIVIIYNKLE